MTRCILCSRCVRFSNQVTNQAFLGMFGRGQTLEVSSYVSSVFNSEYSGNIIDLCPVGAFTSKAFKFKGRAWELQHVTVFDFVDVFGKLINISFKNNEICRVLPVKTLEIGSNWISDRIRFSYDSYKLQRIVSPMVKIKNQFIKKSWKNILITLKRLIIKGSIVGIVGENTDLETVFFFKKFLNFTGSSSLLLDAGSFDKKINQDFQSNYLISKIHDVDFILIVNVNLRFELESLNLQIREKYYQNFDLKIYNIGQPLNVTYPVKQVGWNLNFFLETLEGKTSVSYLIKKAKQPVIFVEPSLYFHYFKQLQALHLNFYEINSLEVGISQGDSKDSLLRRSQVLFLVNANFVELKRYKKKIIIFLGFQGGINTTKSRILLPGLPAFEKKGSSLSIHGLRLQFDQLFKRYKLSRADFKVFRVLNYYFNKNVVGLSRFSFELPKIKKISFINMKITNNIQYIYHSFGVRVKNYYLTSNFNKKSLNMQSYAKVVKLHQNSYFELKKNN